MTDFTRRGFIATLACLPFAAKVSKVLPRVEWTTPSIIGPSGPPIEIISCNPKMHSWLIKNAADETVYVGSPGPPGTDVFPDSQSGIGIQSGHTLTIELPADAPWPILAASRFGALQVMNLTTGHMYFG